MHAPKGNGLTAGNSQPAIANNIHTPDSKTVAASIGAFPSRHNTVTAEVLCRLISGENLTGMDAVFGCSTTRLSAVIFYLTEKYGWAIDHADIDVGTNDGRVVLIRAYFLPRATIRRAFDTGALEFCRSVREARAKRRTHATKAKAEADKRNAARAAAKFDPNQGALFSGAAP
jgi:hypothetical protein